MAVSDAEFFLKLMHYIRAFETMIAQLRSGQLVPFDGFRFRGATHVSIGQEAVAVGACAALQVDDYITSTHRGHGHGIAKGAFVLRDSNEEQLEEAIAAYREAAKLEPTLSEDGTVAQFTLEQGVMKISTMKNGKWGFHL